MWSSLTHSFAELLEVSHLIKACAVLPSEVPLNAYLNIGNKHSVFRAPKKLFSPEIKKDIREISKLAITSFCI